MRILIAIALLALSAPTLAAERRCGWLDNPTPGNWWLTDAHGEWTISTQGGAEARGMERLPDMSGRDWVRTNGSYGFGCACMTAHSRRSAMQIVRIVSATRRPLSACRADRALPPRR